MAIFSKIRRRTSLNTCMKLLDITFYYVHNSLLYSTLLPSARLSFREQF